MKKLISSVLTVLFSVFVLVCTSTTYAQQLPNADFEDWSGAAFDGKIQPAYWNFSNVNQLGIKFNFANQVQGRSGYALMVQDQKLEVMGIGETSPGYIALGTPWVYISGLTAVNQATAGTYGGINFTYRPDTLQVWIKRTGDRWADEDFHILFYSWSGTSKAPSYKGKNGSCTSVTQTDEESDIRQALDANECGTPQKATQIAEGWLRDRKEYKDWTLVKVPIYYMSDDLPEKCNVIFSASNYPNFRANSGLYVGNSLYVDDVELIYSASIDHIYFDNKEWKGFDPSSADEQVYSLGENATAIPQVRCVRGAGQLTNARGTTATFAGRTLTSDEVQILEPGEIGGAPMVLKVTSADAKHTKTYQIRFVREPSSNARLSAVYADGEPIKGFSGYVTDYTVTLPYGTTAVPAISADAAEEGQQIRITQAASLSDAARIEVTAPDNKTTLTYTIRFEVALLDDNTLQNILVNSEPVKDFVPTLNTYRVELPLGTEQLPVITPVSAYPEGEQTITISQPDQIEGGICQITVQVPGNTAVRTYKLTYKITASTYSLLADLKLGDYLQDFRPENTTYYVNFPLGTTELPELTYEKGDPYQNVEVEYGGIDGTTRVIVTAASGAETVYKIICTTEKSDVVTLKNIFLDGQPLSGFSSSQLTYAVSLPVGTEALPSITWEQGDEYQNVTLTTGGLNGTTRIVVTAGNGNSAVYLITFSVERADNVTLSMIYLDAQPLSGFRPEQNDYTVTLPRGTVSLPAVTWDTHDPYQTVTYRSEGVNGTSRITVRAQSGASAVYTIRFSVETSSVTDLEMIYLDGQPLENFSKTETQYTVTLPVGVAVLPEVTYQTADDEQQVLSLREGNVHTITVTAGSGARKTYTITFIIQKSENAFLRMIYLDGTPIPNFESTELNYTDTLLSESLPRITVDKEYGQQVTILTPSYEGMARILVRPETGASNTYTVTFVRRAAEEDLLEAVFLDGEPFLDFDPNRFEYDLTYSVQLPEVTCKAAKGQQVAVQYADNEVHIVVSSGDQQTVYTLRFNQVRSSDTSLASILLDSDPLPDFSADRRQYDITLPAGSSIPVVTWVQNDKTQSVFCGFTEANRCELTVQAEDGSSDTYTLHFIIQPYTAVELLSIELDGEPLALESGKYTYTVAIDRGTQLPVLTYTTAPGQTVLSVNRSARMQTILVQAESGATATYTIFYRLRTSDNALLSAVLLNGDTLRDFLPETFFYRDTLEWRTQVVPSITPVGAVQGQIYEIAYGRIDTITTLRVLAPDSITEQTYTFAFPVRKSANTALDDVFFDDLDFSFDPETLDYTIILPYQTRTVPRMQYFTQEPEQSVRYINAPVTDTTFLVVTAENGDTRTYRFAFRLTDSDSLNVLRSLSVVETGETLSLENETISVSLPYGTTDFNLTYEKSYDEQTVILQPGGIHRPTIITLRANRDDEPDKVYTVIPLLETQCPAVLTSLSVNAEPVADFDPNRFSYIVNVTTNPIIDYTLSESASIIVEAQSDKYWQAKVTAGDYTNTYKVWYYYEAEVLPNNEFTEWTTAQYNNAPKPVSWQVPADVVGKASGLLGSSYTVGDECSQIENGILYLKTAYRSALARSTPGVATLGTLSGSLSSSATALNVSGGIPFHNSPDTLLVYYKAPTIYQNNRIAYQLSGSNGTDIVEHKDNSKVSDYTLLAMDLTELNATVGYPSTMNIILTSYRSETGGLGSNGGMNTQAEMYVDWLRFAYNSRLSALQVNGDAALLEDNIFTYTLSDAEHTELPALTFIGEVSDQAQQIQWTAETPVDAFGVRTASVRNFAEDGTYTDYQIILRRPLSTVDTLRTITVDGELLDEWNADRNTYNIPVAFGQHNLPDVQVALASQLQQVAFSWQQNTLSVTVTPEYGEPRVYTLNFVEQISSDVTLRSLTAEGVDYNPETTTYELVADRLPDITFQKQSDGQTVDLNNGVLTVTAEDGQTTGTYTINLIVPEIHTSGQLTALNLDGNTLEGFSSDTYDYTHPQPSLTSFVREYPQDSVFQTITPDSILWTVIGSETHTYRLIYPSDPSSNTLLDNILVNSEPLEDFLPQLYAYTLRTDAEVDICVVPAEAEQTVAVSVERYASSVGHDTIVYTIAVTAENRIDSQDYTLTILPDLTDDASLEMITLNGIDLPDFAPEQYEYTVYLPVSDPKTVEPLMPSVSWRTARPYQTVTMEPAELGQTFYLIVDSEDRTNHAQYEVTVLADSSHNALLDGILVDGRPIASFSPERNYYSAWVTSLDAEVVASSRDRFQTIEQQRTAAGCVLHVTAEDNRTVRNYTIDFYLAPLSSDATLADILLDDMSFTDYNPSLTPFSPMNNTYTIPLASGASVPDVAVHFGSEGQTVDIFQEGDNIRLVVTAPDGQTTNTYTLSFSHPLSSNADLSMIYIGSEPLTGFDPAHTVYTVQLPVGTATIPTIYALRAEETQRLENEMLQGSVWSVDVVAEDATRKTYVLNFDFLLSETDTLQMLYIDGEELTDFDAHTYFYSVNLPVGTARFPLVEWTAGDRWQTVEVDTLSYSLADKEATYQYVVYSQSGKKNIYTLVFTIIKSDVSTLQNIYIDNKPLTGFSADKFDYDILLPYGSAVLPNVDYEAGDAYQTVDIISNGVNGDTKLSVTAENGRGSVYTLHFSVAKSNNAQLKAIFIAGQPISNFDSEISNYSAPVQYGWSVLPAITYEKSEDAQNVTLTINGMTATLYVVAEDGTDFTYSINFYELKSSNATLQIVYIDGERFYQFDKNVFEYHLPLPYTAEQMPVITWQTEDEQQTVIYEQNGPFVATLVVISGNEENITEYVFYFERELCDINTLDAITLNGELLAGFDPEITDYIITYPAHTDSTELATVDDFNFVKTEQNASVEIRQTEDATIMFIVRAENSDVRVYVITQKILLPDNSQLADIIIDGRSLKGFTPDVYEYEYLLLEGELIPILDAVAQDEESDVDITLGAIGEPTYIYCTAPNGSESVYMITFRYTDLNTAQAATANDVLLKHIKGSNQYVAYSVRNNVQIAIYDEQGALQLIADVPVCNPNMAQIVVDSKDSDLLYDATDPTQGKIITIEHLNHIFYYAFYENQQRRITSGKIMLQQ